MIASQLNVIRDTRKTGSKLKVSMIVPVYNVERYVSDCLRSILSASYLVDLEIIIVDDGSTDNSVNVILGLLESAERSVSAIFVSQKNQGLSAVRNVGVGLSRGEYICFLDSDDFILPEGLRSLVDYAELHNCDVVMGRSLVFDSKSHKVQPFYDDWVWSKILDGMDHRLVQTSDSLPLCFCLEPNANYRLCKRSFYLENNFHYPEGRLFEDPPVHLKMLAKAERIGFVNVSYYWYRVNRPGKITNEKSERRFDIFAVVSEAIQNLKACQVNDEQGGAALYGLFRLVWWCGTMSLPEHRASFFNKACDLFRSEVPEAWDRVYFKHYAPDTRHSILGVLFTRGKSKLLEQLSFEKRQPISLLLFLISIGWVGILVKFGSTFFRRAVNRLLDKTEPAVL